MISCSGYIFQIFIFCKFCTRSIRKAEHERGLLLRCREAARSDCTLVRLREWAGRYPIHIRERIPFFPQITHPGPSEGI